ncbi:hypothetical protein AB6B39_10385 [Algimonas porphyrae]|uniref:tetratricopeptide repeat protein n=1 Tax=Algimonas porphyrae TaxID=1128113 RepID=UPI003529F2A0
MSKPARAIDDTACGLSDMQAEAVRAQLARILDHALFSDTTRMKRFLTYVVEEAIAGRGARLKGYTIGLEVFDKPSDFNSQTDTIVRVQASQLRRRLDLYYADAGESDPIRLTIPKGRYAPRFEVRSPRTQQGDSSVDDDAEASGEERGLSRPGLAVVTFVDDTGPSDSAFFAKGLTAEIISALVQFRHIRVIAQHPDVPGEVVAASLSTIDMTRDVQFVLSGNVRRSADVFRVVATLSAADTGQVLYRETFDRVYAPDTVFELQESIASNVAAAVAAPFGQINRHNRRLNSGRRQSISAYEAVLRFYEMGLGPSREDAASLLHDIEVITDASPNFSTGFAIRSMLNSYMCTQCIPPGSPDHFLVNARGLAQKAMSIDPMNSMAYFAAFQALHHSGDVRAGEQMAQKAMTLNPNDYAMLAYFALTRAAMGDVETAAAYDASARRLVTSPPAWFDAASLLIDFVGKDYEGVIARIGEIKPSSPVHLIMLKIACLGLTDEIESGIKTFQRVSDGASTYAQEAMRMLQFWQVDRVIEAMIIEGWSRLGLMAGPDVTAQ